MGEGIANGTSKGPVHRKTDEYLNHKDAAGKYDRREVFLGLLESPEYSYMGLLANQIGLSHAEASYLKRTWYDAVNGWWKDCQPIEPVSRLGLIKALREAIAGNLPMDSYWVANGDRFEVAVMVSEHQVTRIIHTPPTPVGPVRNRTTPVPIWRIARGAALTDETMDEVLAGISGDIVTRQRKELYG